MSTDIDKEIDQLSNNSAKFTDAKTGISFLVHPGNANGKSSESAAGIVGYFLTIPKSKIEAVARKTKMFLPQHGVLFLGHDTPETAGHGLESALESVAALDFRSEGRGYFNATLEIGLRLPVQDIRKHVESILSLA